MFTLDDTLVFAASAGNFKLVRERVAAGANVDHIVAEKGTALYAGIRSAQCISFLLAHKADPNHYKSAQGHTALDHALSMAHYVTAQSAFLIYCAGGRANAYSFIPPPTSAQIYQGRILLPSFEWFTYYTVGQVCFGVIEPDNEQWCFDCVSRTTHGQFFRIEALYLPDRLNIHCVERTDDGFFLVDFRGRRHNWPDSPEEMEIEATVSVLSLPVGEPSPSAKKI